MSTDPNRQGQYPPPQWNSQPGQSTSYPPPSQYPDPSPSQGFQYPPPASDNMQTLPPQQQDQYRLPAPHTMYAHPQDYRGPPQTMYQQPAPRQRTAIACRYCRRRKIRCSGFDASEDGRCTNCIRFNQECMFTPVSSQAHQAFVPAHAAYPHLRNAGAQGRAPARSVYPSGQPVLYGAHGQPLGPMPPDPNVQAPPGYYQAPYPGPAYDDRAPPHPQDQVSRKRPRLDDPHTPVLLTPSLSNESPSSPSGQQRSGRRGSGGGYEYPDPTNLAPVSPATSASSYQSHPPQHQYYAPPAPQPRRSSPQGAYPAYDSRASDSPHGSVSSASGNYHPGLHPPQVLPPTRDNGRTPPPAAGGRGAMSVQNMLGPAESQGGRTNTDSEMLNALNRRGPN